MSDDDTSNLIEAEFREYVQGNLDQDDPDAYWYTGLVQDPELRSILAFCERSYEPLTSEMPSSFKDTAVGRHIRKEHGSDTGTQALQAGAVGQLSYFSGLVGYQQDVSGMQVLMNMQQMIEDIPVFLAYLYGDMGNGKTDFSMLLLEVFASVYGRDSVHFAANLESDDLDEEILRYSRVVEMLEERRERIQDGEDLDPLVFVIDEAAQIFTGSGADQHRAKQLAKILKLARKAKANMLLIGQDGKDIDASLRALCTVFVHKEAEKTATFYQDVKDRQGINKMMSLSGIPETSYNDYSTYDEGEFIFDDDDDEEEYITEEELEDLIWEHEREMMAILAVSTDMTQAEIGDIYDVSEKTVRRAKKRHEDHLEDLGLLDSE